jgi:hypothetical protein
MYSRRLAVLASFDQMQRFLYLTKSALDQATNESQAAMKILQTDDYHDERKEEIFSLLHDEFIEVNYQFPCMLYSSFLSAWYSFVEHNLIQLCDDLQLTVSIKIHERDDAGTGIQRANKFLKEAAKYEVPDKYWQELNRIRQIRNKIVHENGELASSVIKPSNEKTVPLHLDSTYEGDPEMLYVRIESNLLQYIEQHALFRYDRQLYLDPSFDYCLGLVDFGRSLFLEIWKGLELE